ncbi:hypothetical protein [Falsiruegeria litorea]|uniref:hypothetical protein n=1 Tax=Falsiruegeria litorea TaxID=1280831 RepID=UPI001BFEBE67|nr:hypothetical protein [Falsiruegeria litorea]MBT8169664.1 hypothetical protein [Falsiruegeria litorea]
MKTNALRPHLKTSRQPVMAGRIAARTAGRHLTGAHTALTAAKAALEGAPANEHTRDALRALRTALHSVSDATACTDHLAGRVR